MVVLVGVLVGEWVRGLVGTWGGVCVGSACNQNKDKALIKTRTKPGNRWLTCRNADFSTE